jgi:Zn finger protein HypA/HybF involved in hydrogenase expression
MKFIRRVAISRLHEPEYCWECDMNTKGDDFCEKCGTNKDLVSKDRLMKVLSAEDLK